MRKVAISTLLKEYFVIFVGALLIALGLYFFWAPSQLAPGGVSGLAVVIKALIPIIPIGMIILFLDIMMFILGFIVLGRSFGIKSIACSIEVSLLITLFEYIVPEMTPLSKDVLVLLIFGALFIAVGQAMVFNLGASSGGTDIIAMIISKYLSFNIGTSLIIADLLVVLLAIGTFGIEKGLYAILGVVITSVLIDYVISGISVQRYVSIIPSQNKYCKDISNYILNVLDRGATIYKAEGAYSKYEKKVITTVLDRREFIELKRYIFGIDSNAFVTVQNLHEAVGEGFGSDKKI